MRHWQKRIHRQQHWRDTWTTCPDPCISMHFASCQMQHPLWDTGSSDTGNSTKLIGVENQLEKEITFLRIVNIWGKGISTEFCYAHWGITYMDGQKYWLTKIFLVEKNKINYSCHKLSKQQFCDRQIFTCTKNVSPWDLLSDLWHRSGNLFRTLKWVLLFD